VGFGLQQPIHLNLSLHVGYVVKLNSFNIGAKIEKKYLGGGATFKILE